MPPLSLGLNLSSKRQPGKPPGPLGQKRKKTIFDDDSDDEGQSNNKDNGAVEISTIGGVDSGETAKSRPAPKAASNTTTAGPPFKKKMTLGEGSGKPNIKPLSKSSIFADEDEDEGDQDKALPLGLNPAKGSGPGDKNGGKQEREYTNLSALHSSRKHAQEAQELDPSIYSYDAVYDSLHAKSNKAKDAAAAQKSEVPKYMTSLLRSAEVRKRDQLRARDKLLAKEREAEGDEFADKEKFVTAAYKAQQEELRRVEQEEEEREKAEEERRRKNGGSGMVGFYRDMLSRGEEKHEEVVKAAEEAAQKVKAGETLGEDEKEGESKEKTEAQMAAEMNASGARVAVNDEGQVVDKRQLLSAGLNVAPKPKTAAAPAKGPGASRAAGVGGRPRGDAGNQSGRAGQRARQTEMIAAQLEENARKEAEEEAARQKEMAERNRSRKTEGDVSSAKERYLARKREREAASK